MESLYLFYGEELYLLEDSVKKIKKLFDKLIEGINYIKIDESNISQLIANIETPCFGFDKKLIIVKNSGLVKKEGKKKNSYLSELSNKVAKYLRDNIENVKLDNVIVFIEDDVQKNELYKVIDEYGKVCNFEAQKLPDLIKRIKSICSAYSVKIVDADAKYFVECCGTNLNDIINELRKLIEYVGKDGVIEKNDIDVLTTRNIESVIFDLTDSLGKKNINQAIQVLNNLIYQKEPIQKILITLYNHFKKLYFVKMALKNNEDILSVLNLKPNQTFLISKYKSQAGFFELMELRNILDELINLDYNYKIGLIDINVGLESILCNYCS